MHTSRAVWRRTICAAGFLVWPWTAPASGPMAEFGVANFCLPILRGSQGWRICAMFYSSCGGLFDAVAALLDIASEVAFEGQAAIALEAAADQGVDGHYDFEIEEGEPMILDFRPAIVAMVKGISSGRRVGEISARFHNTLSAAVVNVC